jgi:hypothetical protein
MPNAGDPRSVAQRRADRRPPSGGTAIATFVGDPTVTLKRLRAYSTLIASVLWTMWAVDMSNAGPVDRLGKIKGTDFLQFYVGGSFAREGRLADFYDVSTEYARARAVIPASADTLYLPVQSPQTALVFAPLAALSYPTAVAIWIAIIVLVYAACCWLVCRDCHSLRRYRAEAIATAMAFPGLYATVLHGQTSIVSLLAISVAVAALRCDRRLLAGAALGCLAFKPHWAAAVVVVFLAAREWRVAAAALVSAGAQIALTYAVAGAAAMRGYWTILVSLQRAGDLVEPRAGDSLRSFFKVFVPSPAAATLLYIVASIGALAIASRVWRSDAAFERRASAMLLAIVLISPHALPYDLILLAPVFILTANWLAAHKAQIDVRPITWSLCALFAAPILAVLPAVLRVQCSVTAMAVLLVCSDRALMSFVRVPAQRPAPTGLQT